MALGHGQIVLGGCYSLRFWGGYQLNIVGFITISACIADAIDTITERYGSTGKFHD